ncbi:MAG TPA: ROK family transcriptional regulator [Symbiobacteriaceae bacterium]
MRRMIRFQDMSTSNRATVLRLIYQLGSVSRAELARRTSMAAPTISRIVDDLMKYGLVIEDSRDVTDSGPGRPPALLRMDTTNLFVVAAACFPGHIVAALCDLDGREQVSVDIPTRDLPADQVINHLGRLIEYLRKQAPDPGRVIGVGLTCLGLVDSRQAIIRYSPVEGWRNVPVASLLAHHTDLPVAVENWVSARAMAEQYFGGAREIYNFIYVHASTGIGAAMVSGGRLRRGESFTSAEFGHWPLSADGPVCRCGRRGCLEAYASLPALPVYAGMPDLEAEEIIRLAREGNPAARAAVEKAVGYLGLGLSGLINLLNPGVLFLDGWPVTAGEVAMEPLRKVISERVVEGLDSTRILRPTQLSGRGKLIGAVTLVLDQLLDLRGELGITRN